MGLIAKVNFMNKKLLQDLAELSDRRLEDSIYEIALSEIENSKLDPVAQTKAFEEAEGDAQKARAFYTKHRVRRISDELKIFKAGLEASVVLNNQKRVAAGASFHFLLSKYLYYL